MFFDRGEFGGTGVVAEDDVGYCVLDEGWRVTRLSWSWFMVVRVERVDVPAIALCEVDGFVA